MEEKDYTVQISSPLPKYRTEVLVRYEGTKEDGSIVRSAVLAPLSYGHLSLIMGQILPGDVSKYDVGIEGTYSAQIFVVWTARPEEQEKDYSEFYRLIGIEKKED